MMVYDTVRDRAHTEREEAQLEKTVFDFNTLLTLGT